MYHVTMMLECNLEVFSQEKLLKIGHLSCEHNVEMKFKAFNVSSFAHNMGGDQCQKYLFLVDVQTYFVGTFFMVIFLFERHLQI